MGDPAQVSAMVAHIEQRLGPIDVLVNNAAIMLVKPFLDTTLDDREHVLRTNAEDKPNVAGYLRPGGVTNDARVRKHFA